MELPTYYKITKKNYNLFADKYQEIFEICAYYYNCDANLISKKTRSKKTNVLFARQALCWILRNEFKLSHKAIGTLLNRDHSTIIYTCNLVDDLISVNDKIKIELSDILKQLNDNNNGNYFQEHLRYTNALHRYRENIRENKDWEE
jgi:chromosomal replication initiation ATPase DnaA